MTITDSFNQLQTAADATAQAVSDARRRRDLFRTALAKFDDVSVVKPSGSLARGTHKDPINDVDLVCVFVVSKHPEWCQSGDSAEAALQHMRSLITASLGTASDAEEKVRRCDLRNHSVKCFLDDPNDPTGFTVDVTPALVHPARGYWIPERNSHAWVHSDPQYLIDEVARRHREWPQFAKLVRVLKRWNSDHGGYMKSLTVEVLALSCLREENCRQLALARFFTAASQAVWMPIVDPAGLCGPIQPNLDVAAAAKELSKAAELALKAVEAEGNEETRRAMCLWNEVFGDIYPGPPGGCGSGAARGLGVLAIKDRPQPRRVVDAPQG